MPEPWWVDTVASWLSSEPPSGESSGGGERDRTDDLLLAKQALSQLSYTPMSNRRPTAPHREQQTLWPDGGSGWIRTIDPRLIKTVL